MEIKLVLKLVCCVAIFNYFLIRVVIGGKNSFNAIVLLLHFFILWACRDLQLLPDKSCDRWKN